MLQLASRLRRLLAQPCPHCAYSTTSSVKTTKHKSFPFRICFFNCANEIKPTHYMRRILFPEYSPRTSRFLLSAPFYPRGTVYVTLVCKHEFVTILFSSTLTTT
ncbi:hypothetical protein QQG55_38560 [Brugia pahangi]